MMLRLGGPGSAGASPSRLGGWAGILRKVCDLMPVQFDYGPYLAILFVICLSVAITLGMIVAAHVIRPARKGPVKDSTYESGMPVIGDARRRFNVRFYVVALLFLLFDVEVVFLWPWAMIFFKSAKPEEAEAVRAAGYSGGPGLLLGAMGLFVAFLVVGYAYEWRKGVFQWD